MARRYNTALIKGDRTYTIEELAETLGVCIGTVRSWLKDGLTQMDHKKPFLVLGHQAKHYLKKRVEKSSVTLAADEFYCFKCRASRKPAGSMADYLPQTNSSGRLSALCEECRTLCNKSIRFVKLADLGQILDIVIEANERAYGNPSIPFETTTSERLDRHA